MQEKLPLAPRIVIVDVALLIGADVDIHQPCLSPVDPDESLAQVRAPVAQRLDLGASQLHARLDGLDHEVVVVGGAIGGADVLALPGLALGAHRRPRSQASAAIGRLPGGWTSSMT